MHTLNQKAVSVLRYPKMLPTENRVAGAGIEDAITILSKAKDMLAQSNIRLHKIVSNNSDVMKAFPEKDLAKGLQDLDIGHNLPPCIGA
ncbi:hypothetical protein NFI96_027575 [Prochilodus magdalenae]|nr:hypothetical protein NFI96_027575 [Prochilodus magdalenae]